MVQASQVERYKPSCSLCCRVLLAEMPELAEGLPSLQRPLAGSVLRPWCHFELPASTYLAQGSPTCLEAERIGWQESAVPLHLGTGLQSLHPALRASCICPACISGVANQIMP